MNAAEITREGGAYAIRLALESPLEISFAGAPRGILAPGIYAYCGSARGPGGLRARLGRHLAGRGPRHWHIDRLTAEAQIVEWWTEVDGRECDLVARLSARPGVGFPIAGFGASDCRRCRAHLLRLPRGPTLARMLARLE